MRDEQSLDVWDEPITEKDMTSLDAYPDLKEVLKNLQGNILSSHGRDNAVTLRPGHWLQAMQVRRVARGSARRETWPFGKTGSVTAASSSYN
jgi:hypothetical protein